jgi:hypothetical protein
LCVNYNTYNEIPHIIHVLYLSHNPFPFYIFIIYSMSSVPITNLLVDGEPLFEETTEGDITVYRLTQDVVWSTATITGLANNSNFITLGDDERIDGNFLTITYSIAAHHAGFFASSATSMDTPMEIRNLKIVSTVNFSIRFIRNNMNYFVVRQCLCDSVQLTNANGGIVGQGASIGAVYNCIHIGNKGNHYATGIAGQSVGSTTASLSGNFAIENCASIGDLCGNFAGMSGIVGWNAAAVTGTHGEGKTATMSVKGCFHVGNAANIDNNTGIIASGYVGFTTGIFDPVPEIHVSNSLYEDCYSIGSYAANTTIGGILGPNIASSHAAVTIRRCYSMAEVGNSANFGGIFTSRASGSNNSVIVEDCLASLKVRQSGTAPTTETNTYVDVVQAANVADYVANGNGFLTSDDSYNLLGWDESKYIRMPSGVPLLKWFVFSPLIQGYNLADATPAWRMIGGNIPQFSLQTYIADVSPFITADTLTEMITRLGEYRQNADASFSTLDFADAILLEDIITLYPSLIFALSSYTITSPITESTLITFGYLPATLTIDDTDYELSQSLFGGLTIDEVNYNFGDTITLGTYTLTYIEADLTTLGYIYVPPPTPSTFSGKAKDNKYAKLAINWSSMFQTLKRDIRDTTVFEQKQMPDQLTYIRKRKAIEQSRHLR